MSDIKRWYDRLRSRTVAFAHDLLMVPAAWLLAYWTRFNLERIPPRYLDAAIGALPMVMAICAAVYWAFGLYRGVWRFASLPDLMRIGKAVSAATLLVLIGTFIATRGEDLPRSVPLLFFAYQLMLLGGPRIAYRWLKDHRLGLRPGLRVLVVGADRPGEMLVRDMLRDRSRRYNPVAFVDDKPRRTGADIHGVPIRGGIDTIPRLVDDQAIDLIMLALPNADDAEMQRLVALCEGTGKPFRTVPPLRSVLDGEVSINQLRPVSIEDLLGRNPVQLDWQDIRRALTGRRILITGAGGSIGSELCRQVARAQPQRLALVENCEFNLYRIAEELAERSPQLDIGRYLIDVTDQVALDDLFDRERPQIVFHAAAYKHVPLLEDQLRAALRNNAIGSDRVAAGAERLGCERFVLISTDKAVNPTSVMGATKRAAERLCRGRTAGSRTRCIVVRFGNVLGSAGSVVPLFQRQIAAGGPVTVTHPEIERFFMTIPEACQLIMQAALIGNGGDVLVLDMGKPIKIRYLAEQMIRLAGREPNRDIPIRYIGLRPGEKLYEELFQSAEDLVTTAHDKILSARERTPDLTPLKPLRRALEEAIDDADEDRLRRLLSQLVPEWHAAPADDARVGADRPAHDPPPAVDPDSRAAEKAPSG